jgi:hypothetical protein
LVASGVVEMESLTKVKPPMRIGPRPGKLTEPSRFTVRGRMRFWLPKSCTFNSSPGPTT